MELINDSPISKIHKSIEKEIGHLKFPLTISTDRDGKVIAFDYETTWRDGEPGNYTDKSLTKKQIETLEGIKKSILNV